MSRPVSRDLVFRDPGPATAWWCSECRERVDGPWHDDVCPMREDES